MPETIQNKQVFSLIEVTRSIQATIAQRYKSAFWVKAEMIKLNHYRHSGHCYPDLVEKVQGKIIAQIRSNLWKSDYERINNTFLNVLKEPLKDGIKILFLAKISFEPVYGIALRIIDIDPGYTLGDLEKEKQETIRRLNEEGIFNKNKALPLPMLPQRIAIISVETSKGYADFLKVIENNPWKYKFFYMLFPSLLQGEKAIMGITGQLANIKRVIHHFDLVAIVRGGGGDVGLSCYNNYYLTKQITNYPLPVITGIGHATNQTVAEMVAFENAITPTKLAEFLIQQFHNFAEPVLRSEKVILEKSQQFIINEKIKIKTEVKLFKSVTQNILNANKNEIATQTRSLLQQANFLINNKHIQIATTKIRAVTGIDIWLKNQHEKTTWLSQKIIERTNQYIQSEKLVVSNLEKNIKILDPQHVLKRGYSITRIAGKAIKTSDQIAEGDEINTTLLNGNIISIVKSKK